MKHWKHILAALMAALMLASACSVSADEALEIEASGAPEVFGIDIVPEGLEDALALDGELPLNVPGIQAPETAHGEASLNDGSDEDEDAPPSPGLYVYDESYTDDEDYFYYCDRIKNARCAIGGSIRLVVTFTEGQPVTWSTSDPAVATVDDGLVTAVDTGTCVITATFGSISLSCSFEVRDPAKLFKYVEGNTDEDYGRRETNRLSLYVTETSRLYVAFSLGRTVSWSSSDTSVATVESGVVTAVDAGSCTVTAKIGVTELKCTVNVFDDAGLYQYVEGYAEGDYDTPIESASMDVGDTLSLIVTGVHNRPVNWLSSNSRIASVENGTVTARNMGCCTISVSIGTKTSFSFDLTVNDPVTLSCYLFTMGIGDSTTLTVNKLFGRSVTWSSSDEKVATVKNGTVTAVGYGCCTITAQVVNGHKQKCNILVPGLSKEKLSLSIGSAATLTIKNLEDEPVKWASDNTKVVRVAEGVVTAVGAGTCTVTALIDNRIRLTCAVTVSDTARLSKAALSLKVNKTAKLTVKGLNGRKVTWSSDNKKIATVKNGTVMAVSAGKCTVTAKLSGGKKLTCKVSVTDPARLSRTALTLRVGKKARLTVKGLVGRKVAWSSGNKKIATVKNGTVTAVKAGKCTITAKLSNGKRLTCRVTVK